MNYSSDKDVLAYVRLVRDYEAKARENADIRLAIVTNFTDDLLGKLIVGMCADARINPSVYQVPFKQYLFELKDPKSALARHNADITFIFFDANPYAHSEFVGDEFGVGVRIGIEEDEPDIGVVPGQRGFRIFELEQILLEGNLIDAGIYARGRAHADDQFSKQIVGEIRHDRQSDIRVFGRLGFVVPRAAHVGAHILVAGIIHDAHAIPCPMPHLNQRPRATRPRPPPAEPCPPAPPPLSAALTST